MRNSKLLNVLYLVFIIGLTFSSCKKSNDTGGTTPPDTFPTPISNIVSQSMVDSLRARGVVINDGTTPPIVNGIYFMHPDSCTYDNSPGNTAGSIYSDYKFRFSSQDNSKYTVTVDQKTSPGGVLSSVPVSSYISGSGNNFSIFILRTVTPSAVPVQQFNVLSGTLTSGGVQGFQNTLYMRSKGGDFDNVLVVPAGTVRVFVTGAPGLATTAATF